MMSARTQPYLIKASFTMEDGFVVGVRVTSVRFETQDFTNMEAFSGTQFALLDPSHDEGSALLFEMMEEIIAKRNKA